MHLSPQWGPKLAYYNKKIQVSFLRSRHAVGTVKAKMVERYRNEVSGLK